MFRLTRIAALLPAAQRVDHFVVGDSQQPGAHLRLPPEAARGPPDDQHYLVDNFRRRLRIIQAGARGHPLALALAADRVLREPEKSFDATSSPDLIHDLMAWLLQDVNEPRRLEALAACATVRSLNEPLLAAMLDRHDVREEFDWLADQHFVERQVTGLVIHDLVREIVVHDLRGRNLELHHTMIRRAAAHLLDALEGAGERAALSAVGDTIYTLRHEPYVKRLFPFRDARCFPDSAGADEIPALKAEVARLEGDESAAWFEYWPGRTGTNVLVMRGSRLPWPPPSVSAVRTSPPDPRTPACRPCSACSLRRQRFVLRANSALNKRIPVSEQMGTALVRGTARHSHVSRLPALTGSIVVNVCVGRGASRGLHS